MFDIVIDCSKNVLWPIIRRKSFPSEKWLIKDCYIGKIF